MKRYGYLINKFEDIEFVEEIIHKAARHKHHREQVQFVLNNIKYFAKKLQDILLNGTYEPSGYVVFTRWDHRNKKERTITATNFFPDQCVHWAIIEVLNPIMLPTLHQNSAGNIPGKGNVFLVNKIFKDLNDDPRKTKYALSIDIRKYFHNINKDILLNEVIGPKIKDKKFMELLKTVIYSYIENVDDPDRGIPLGNYCSQWFANYYLSKFDHFINEKLEVKHYYRFVDDILIVGSNKRKLRKILMVINEYLALIGLEIKDNYQIYPIDDRGITYIGYVIKHQYVNLRARNFLKLRRQCMEFQKMLDNDEYISEHFALSLLSRIGQMKHCNNAKFHKLYLRKGSMKILKKIAKGTYY